MAARYPRDDSKITVEVNGVAYEGWLESEVERSLEAICGTFTIPVSMVPGQPPAIKRQAAVRVRIGGVQVINGFVVAAEPFYNRKDCGFMVTGRDRTGDLVRCSAVHKGGQWRNAKLEQVCKDLLAPYGIEVKVETDTGAALQDFKLAHGESVTDALSRAARLRGVLVTRDDDGRLLLTKAGALKFGGAIVRGQNVISMQGIGTDEQRHSQYIVYGQQNCIGDFEVARGLKATATDAEVTRYLPLVINADGNTTQAELQTLVDHTARVRRGHAYGIRYTVEGWTHQGAPWPLNQRVAVYDDVAGLGGEEWLITSVRQHCTLQEGDVTELVVRPIEAYDTAPLKTKVRRRNWGNKGNTTNHARGPRDGAQGGAR